MKEQSQHILIEKLDEFIRRYYKNRLLKGALYSVGLLVSFFLLISLLEYFGNFGTLVRTVIFWGYTIAALAILYFYVAIPLLKMNRLGKVISYESASEIIGKHFPEVSDKLLNVLQLSKLAFDSDSELLQASIEQKTKQLKPIPFVKAIDFSQNKKYLKYASIPVFVLLVLAIALPAAVTEPSKRIIQHNTYFEKPAPFKFELLNKELEIPQQENFTIQLKVSGDELPNEVFVIVEGNPYKMQKDGKMLFSYELNNVQKNLNFHFEAVEVRSVDYLLKILPKPILIDFRVQLTYPAYTGKPSETLQNTGDLVVPKGTDVQWLFQTRDTRTFYFNFNEKDETFQPDANGRLSVAKRIMGNAEYGFYTSNEHIVSNDSLRFSVAAIEDAYPQIVVLEQRDSLLPERVFFKGQIKDDYGFAKLQFKLFKTNTKDTSVHINIIQDLNIAKTESAQEFYYFTDLALLEIKPGDRVEYYFEVWDNDGVNGSKSTVSKAFVIEIPGLEQITEMTDKNARQIEEQGKKSMDEIKKMQKEIAELMKKLVDKKDFSWQEKKQMEELLKKQQELRKAIQDMQQRIEQNNRLDEQYKNLDQAILDKQKELERLFKELMSDEMKNMFQEIEKLTKDQVDKDKLKESLDKIKNQNESVEKQLDRDLELMKHLEVEKKLDEAIQKTKDLADKQRNLSEETKDKNVSTEEMKKKQDALNQEFKDVKKQLDEVKKKNEEMESPLEYKRNEETEKSVAEKQENASKELDKKNKKEASQKQKEAADELDKMKDELSEMKEDAEDKQLAEDAEEIRQLLKNLIKISFEEERLMQQLNGMHVQDPAYQNIIKGQAKIRDDFKMVEDSLLALGKRQIQISSVVNKELANINSQFSNAIDKLLYMNQSIYGKSENYSAQTSQQYVMTSINNLSLILAESLDKMQNQQRSNSQKKKSRSKSKSNSSCDNPGESGKPNKSKKKGNSKPDAKTMSQLQQQLNKQLEALKKSLDEKGKQGGKGHKVGENSEMNQEIARMAAQQEQLRRALQQYNDKLKQESGGKANGNLDKLIQEMEQTETDLVNKRITPQTLNRQQEILTRLLEHEKAEQKQEQEQKRESKEGKEFNRNNQSDLLEYNKLKTKELEMLRTVPPSFSLFYKQKVNEYFYNFGEQK